MLYDPALPLRTLPGLRTTEEETNWTWLARQACSESLQQINSLLAAPVVTDRDIHSCLIAIRASLQLVLSESLSTAQISATVRRALQIFDRLAGIQSISHPLPIVSLAAQTSL